MTPRTLDVKTVVVNDPVPQASCCPAPCSTPIVENIPGPQGTPGTNGTNGSNGLNATSITTAQFTMPSVSSNVVVAVDQSQWIVVGQVVYVQTAGYFLAISTGSVTITLENLGYVGNTSPTTVITSGQKLSPGGIKGADGSIPGGALEAANNLSDVASASTSRSNLGLGSLAVLNSVNNGNWSGTALAVGNGGTGATIAATALSNLGGQPVNALLTSLATQGASANEMYYTSAPNVIAVLATTAFGRSALTDVDAPSFRARMGGLLPRYGCLGFMKAVNLNAATSDNALTIESGRYRLDKITVENASVSMTTATLGVFTAAGGGGTTVVADQAIAALTASSKFLDLTLGGSVTADVVTAGTLYVRCGTPNGGPATADVFLFGWKYD